MSTAESVIRRSCTKRLSRDWCYSHSVVVFGQTAPVHGRLGAVPAAVRRFRFFVEFYRVPDAHLGYLALDWVTMGQILSVPMIIAGP